MPAPKENTYLAEVNFIDNSTEYRLAKAKDDIVVHDVIYSHFNDEDNYAISITILCEMNENIIE